MQILLIEQHALLARALKQGLEEEGFAVTVAATGPEQSRTVPASVDAVILDLSLPEEASLFQLRRLRRDGLTTPVLLLTTGKKSQGRPGRTDQASDSLSKPFELEELFSRLRRLLHQPDQTPISATC